MIYNIVNNVIIYKIIYKNGYYKIINLVLVWFLPKCQRYTCWCKLSFGNSEVTQQFEHF